MKRYNLAEVFQQSYGMPPKYSACAGHRVLRPFAPVPWQLAWGHALASVKGTWPPPCMRSPKCHSWLARFLDETAFPPHCSNDST